MDDLEDTCENLICVEFVSASEQTDEKLSEYESQAGNIYFLRTIMITDPIADLFVRIRNGYMARQKMVRAPYSKVKERLLKILVKNKYVASYEVVQNDQDFKELHIGLNDIRETRYVPTLRRISKPGQRIYIKSKDIRKSRNGVGIYLISTPKGIITGYEARALNVGGELVGEIF